MKVTTTGLFPKRALIIGARGFLGSHFLAHLSAHTDVVATHHQPVVGMRLLDLVDPKVPEGDFEVAWICAGLGTPRRCQEDPERCYQADVIGITKICRQLCDRGILPVVFSSSYAADPRDAYGWQKWEIEQKVAPYSQIIRIGKLFGTTPGDGTFFDEMAQKLLSQQKIVAAIDQFMNLVSVHEVVQTAVEIAVSKTPSIVNFFAPAQETRYQMACFLAQAMGFSQECVLATDLAQLGFTKRSDYIEASHYPFSSWQQGALALAKAYSTQQHLLSQL